MTIVDQVNRELADALEHLEAAERLTRDVSNGDYSRASINDAVTKVSQASADTNRMTLDFTEKRWVVVWHERNRSGRPEHVMGMSDTFATYEEARKWVENSVAEDRERHENGLDAEEAEFEDETDGDVRATEGNNQTTWYCICEKRAAFMK
ncbi:MAG: hypothetical protein HUJ63_09975 [Enterococcus sp.]|nr:hypothetical protein [Enterococcus sp.]